MNKKSGGYQCIKCGSSHTIVSDSRSSILGSKRRRRVCRECKARFTTYETSYWNPDIIRRINNLKKEILALERSIKIR